MSKNLKQALGPRLYTAAKTMFAEIFDDGNHGVLIGGAARNIYLRDNPRPTKDLDINAHEQAFRILKQPPKYAHFYFSPNENDPNKMTATYLTKDKENSVKSDVRLKRSIFQPALFRHTILDPESHIRYPTIHHLVALKVAGFIGRTPGQDGKKQKDLDDIVGLTGAMFTEDEYKGKISREIVNYYLPDNAINTFMAIVRKDYKNYEDHMQQFLLPLFPGSRTSSPSRAAPPATGTVVQGASTAAKVTAQPQKRAQGGAASSSTSTTAAASSSSSSSAAAAAAAAAKPVKKAAAKKTASTPGKTPPAGASGKKPEKK